MNRGCHPYCRANGRLNSKELKRVILEMLRNFGININSKIANKAPGWAEEILVQSMHVGPGCRYTAIAYYFAQLCDRICDLSLEQQQELANDISVLQNESFLAMVHKGKDLCAKLYVKSR